MIFYFSGTGNSRFIEKRIQEKTGDEMYSLNEAIKQKKFFSGKTPETAVFVVPAYAWRIPEIVETWIRKSKFDIGMKAYFAAFPIPSPQVITKYAFIPMSNFDFRIQVSTISGILHA